MTLAPPISKVVESRQYSCLCPLSPSPLTLGRSLANLRGEGAQTPNV